MDNKVNLNLIGVELKRKVRRKGGGLSWLDNNMAAIITMIIILSNDFEISRPFQLQPEEEEEEEVDDGGGGIHRNVASAFIHFSLS